MINQIKFSIDKADLMEALRFLSPFIVLQKNEEYESEDESELTIPEPYFGDKVTFLLYKTHVSIFVLTKEMAKIEWTCDVETNVEEVSFCMSHAYLMQEVEKIENDSERYTFREDRFFGFNVFDSISGRHLFDVDAHSVSKQPSIHPKFFDTLYPHTVSLEHTTLIKVLKESTKYTIPNKGYIWFNISDGKCQVTTCSGSNLRRENFPTRISGNHIFSLPGKFADRISNIIAKWTDSTCQQIGYNNTYLRLYKFNRNSNHGESIEVPLCGTALPSFLNSLEKRNITYQSSVSLRDLRSALRMIDAMDYKEDSVLIHFFPDHLNFYNQDLYYERSLFHFIDAENSNGEQIIKLNLKILESILEEIHTDRILFTLVDDYLLYINGEDESLFGDIIRIICTSKLQKEDFELLERGDNSMNSHEEYIERYLTKYENEEDSSFGEYATIDEMKVEAIRRMKEVIDYTDIIDYFEETGLPQVYEPPYGASYSLEDDELEYIKSTENSRHILVWGVIRCFMFYNRQRVTVDCLLHVSQYKKEWGQECEDLRNGLPYVYTVMKEYPVTDGGHINVYKSEGGTLLRK